MIIVDALTGMAGGLIVGLVADHMGYRRAIRKIQMRAGKPYCEGCKHHVSYHREQVDYKKGEKVTSYENCYFGGGDCSCRHYVGPTPLPEYYAGEL